MAHMVSDMMKVRGNLTMAHSIGVRMRRVFVGIGLESVPSFAKMALEPNGFMYSRSVAFRLVGQVISNLLATTLKIRFVLQLQL